MKKRILIITILLLTVGFAAIATNIILNGNVNIGYNKFIIVFTSAIVDEKDLSSQAISKSGTELTFTTKELTSIGDTSTLNFIATNTSKQYDANVVFDCKGIGENTDYYEIEKEFPTVLNAGTSESGVVRVRLTKPALDPLEGKITCTLDFEAVELEEKQVDIGEVYQDEILHGADPVLSDELIPVTIADDGTVTMANIHTRWYSYTDKEWANAVILVDEAPTYEMGDTIPEEMIESYFVWIPRYRYKLFDMGNYNSYINAELPTTSKAHEIEIVFESRENETSDAREEECTTPLASGESGNCKVGDYMTHPAFITFDVNGLWVGKYEIGYKNADTISAAEKNEINSDAIVIKPNTYIWRNNTVGNFFKSAYHYKRNLDSHMMKNTEWGAVAYLSHSKYGINNQVNVNNHSEMKTGYSSTLSVNQSLYPGTSGTTSEITQPYNTETGYLASTTGNITGVYDMSGGSYRFMASYVEWFGVKSRDNIASGLTEEDFVTYEAYFDKYAYNDKRENYYYRILGDATGEMGPFYYNKDTDNQTRNRNNWYQDHSHFITDYYPWTIRGGSCYDGVLAGQFHFAMYTGDGYYGRMGTCLVLSIK